VCDADYTLLAAIAKQWLPGHDEHGTPHIHVRSLRVGLAGAVLVQDRKRPGGRACPLGLSADGTMSQDSEGLTKRSGMCRIHVGAAY
jgi:hypothetical protein